MKKKILSLLLVVITSAGSAFADFDYSYYVTVDKKYYYLDTENHTAELKGSGNWNAESLTIPSTISYNGITYTVISIGRQAIVNHKNLVSVSLPNTITNIGDAAFHGCSKLESIVIPNNVENIGGAAFDYCYALNNVIFGDNVISIGDKAFYECNSLTTVVIPESVTNIGYAAFAFCSSITSINIPSSLTNLNNSVFANCSSLTSIIIPSSIKSIIYSFSNCVGLTSVTCMAVEPPTLSNGFYGVDCSTIPLYVPNGSVDDYQSANEWKDFQPIRGINEEGISNTVTQQQTKKYIDNGNVLIISGNKIYTISGQEVE